MLSSRGAQYAKIDFRHGVEDAYDPVSNPNGDVSFNYSENVS